MRTYVEYNLPHKDIPAGTCIVERVFDRDIAKLDFPKEARGFYFFDSNILAEDPYDAQSDQRNCSPFYIIAEKVITAEEAEKIRPLKKFPPRPKLAARKPGESLFKDMSKEELSQIFWDISLKKHRYFAVMEDGGLKPVPEDHIVVNRAKEQLYPKPDAPFTPALEQRLHVLKPLHVHKQPPKNE
jgi:hypothetical protein